MWVLDEGTRELTPSQRRIIFEKVSTPFGGMGSSMWNDIYSILQPHHKKYHTHYSQNVWDIFYLLDEKPTTSMNHMIGVPLMPNAHTGVMRLPIEVVSFDPATDAKKCTEVGFTEMINYAKLFEKKNKEERKHKRSK